MLRRTRCFMLTPFKKGVSRDEETLKVMKDRDEEYKKRAETLAKFNKQEEASYLLKNISSPVKALVNGHPLGMPPDPLTVALDSSSSAVMSPGETALAFLRKELNLGENTLEKFRNAVVCSGTEGLDIVSKKPTLWADTAEDDKLLRWLVNVAKGCVSPSVAIRQTPSDKASTTFVAKRKILTGQFLYSIPSDMVLIADPPSGEDPLQEEFLKIEDIALRLAVATSPKESAHFHYADYLRTTVNPPKNLPYLPKSELKTQDGLDLWNTFHEGLQGCPQSQLMTELASPEEFLWYVSTVLSRRINSSMLVPVLDKLNHSHKPNAYYTMATEDTMSGLDIADNVFAGVSAEQLYKPFVHVFSIREIDKGEPVTISYSDMSPKSDQGQDLWKLVWGFVPEFDALFSEKDLRNVAGMVAEQRLAARGVLFPVSHRTDRETSTKDELRRDAEKRAGKPLPNFQMENEPGKGFRV